MRTRSLLAAVFLLSSVVTAHAQWNIGTGLSVTSGYASDPGDGSEAESGSDVGLYVWPRYQVSDNLTFGVRLSFFGSKDETTFGTPAIGFLPASSTTITAEASVIGALATGEYNFTPDSDFQIYAGAEFGIYAASATLTTESNIGGVVNSADATGSESYFSVGAGGGIRYWLSDSFGLEGSVFIDLTFDEFVPVLVPANFGVVFKL